MESIAIEDLRGAISRVFASWEALPSAISKFHIVLGFYSRAMRAMGDFAVA